MDASSSGVNTAVILFDRQVILEHLPPGASAYQLGRTWLHAHPDRQEPAAITRGKYSRRAAAALARRSFNATDCRTRKFFFAPRV